MSPLPTSTFSKYSPYFFDYRCLIALLPFVLGFIVGVGAQPCLVYWSPGICKTCNEGYYKSGLLCYQCDRHCSTCEASCPECLPGYGFKGYYDKTCEPCDDRCEECFERFYECQRCKPFNGFKNNEQVCESCSSWCLQCYANNEVCEKCQDGYGKTSGGACAQCEPGCLLCQEDNEKCTSCENQSHIIDERGKCGVCPSNCVTCNQDISKCEQCGGGYGKNEEEKCSQCEANCNICSNNYTVCTECKNDDDYVLDSLGKCGFCPNNCTQCGINIQECEVCENKFGKTNDKQCHSCEQFCLDCADNYTFCTQCEPEKVRDSLGKCGECPSHCNECPTDLTKCEVCAEGYGLAKNGDGSCQQCETNCERCEHEEICLFCEYGYGVDDDDGCKKCRSHCNNCSEDRDTCTECERGYGLDLDDHSCDKCKEHCLECFDNDEECTLCVDDAFHGLNGHICEDCHDNCETCKQENYEHCLSCSVSEFLNVDHCDDCGSHCLQCNNETSCINCKEGFVLEPNGSCFVCPDLCATCNKDTQGRTICLTCISDEYELDMRPPEKCREFCGDGVTTAHECDNALNIAYDGCDNNCEEMEGFKCEVQEDRTTICSYEDTLQLKLITFHKEKLSSEFEMTLSVFPPLYNFTISTPQIFTTMFKVANQGVRTTKVIYDAINQTLTLHCEYTQSLAGQQIEVTFSQLLVEEQNTHFAIDQIKYPLFFLSSFAIYLSQIIFPLCVAICTLAWLSFFMGLLLRKTAGVEALMTIQFCWLTILWMNSQLSLPLAETIPLKYSLGYGIAIFHSKETYTSSAPYTHQFALSGLFANNFNISLFVLFLPICAIVVTYFRFRTFRNEHIDIDQDSKTFKVLIKREKRFERCLETLFSFCCAFYCAFLHFSLCFVSHSDSLTHIASWVMLITFTVVFVSVNVKFHLDPSSFGCFLFAFKIPHFLFHFIWIQIVLKSVSIAFLVFLNSLPFLLLVPETLTLCFLCVKKPYIHSHNNYRQIANSFVNVSFITFKVIAFYEPFAFDSMRMWTLCWILINLLLLFCVIAFANVTMIYEFVFLEIVLFNKRIIQNAKKTENHMRNMKVLRELTTENVRRQMKHNERETTFKKLLPSIFSIRAISDAAREEFAREFDANELQSEGLKIMRTSLRNQSTWLRSFSDDQTALRSKRIRETLKKEFLSDMKPSVSQRMPKRKESEFMELLNEDDTEDTKDRILTESSSPSKEKEKYDYKNAHFVTQSYESVAKKVLLEENTKINFQAAEDYIAKYDYELKNKEEGLFKKVYDII